MTVTLKDSNSVHRKVVGPSSYELKGDKFGGFIEAVDNGQTRLALEYAVYLVTELNNEIFRLNERVQELEKPAETPAPAKSQPRKSTKKSTTAAKTEEKTETEDTE